MKLFLVAILSTVVIAANLATTKGQEEDFMAMRKEAIDECTTEHKVSNEAVKGVVDHMNVSEDPELKCWLSCVFKKLGVIKEGKIDWERCKTITKHCLFNDEDKAKVDKITKICQAEVPADEKDECQLAYSATVCKIRNWNDFGLPMGSPNQS